MASIPPSNPYQEVIDWLHTVEGQRWSRENHQLVGFRQGFYQVIPPNCGSCINGTSHVHHTFRRAAGDLSKDGPYTLQADDFARRGTRC